MTERDRAAMERFLTMVQTMSNTEISARTGVRKESIATTIATLRKLGVSIADRRGRFTLAADELAAFRAWKASQPMAQAAE